MEGGAGGGVGANNPRTVEQVFRDFKGRRAGLVKALTTGKLCVCVVELWDFRAV